MMRAWPIIWPRTRTTIAYQLLLRGAAGAMLLRLLWHRPEQDRLSPIGGMLRGAACTALASASQAPYSNTNMMPDQVNEGYIHRCHRT